MLQSFPHPYCQCRAQCCKPQACCQPIVIPVRGPQGVAGAQGATGPAGPAGGLSAYGGAYHSAVQRIAFPAANTYVPLTLDTAMPLFGGVSYAADALTVPTTGNYEITFVVAAAAAQAADVSLAVRRNGTNLPSATTNQTLSVDNTTTPAYNARIFGNTIVSLTAGDVLDLAVAVLNVLPAGLNLDVGNNAGSTLTIKLLG